MGKEKMTNNIGGTKNAASPKNTKEAKPKISEQEKEARISKKAAAEKEKQEYFLRKKKMLEFEKKNFDKIVLFKATKGFYVIAGHSAVILFEMIAPLEKLHVVMREDTDIKYKFKEGLISVKDLDFYKQALPGCELIKNDYKESELCVMFYLKEALSPEQYRLYEDAEKIKSEELMNMASSAVVMTGLYSKVRELINAVFASTKKMDKYGQEMIGAELMRDATELERTFLIGARKEEDLDAALTKISLYASRIHVDLKIIEDMGIWRARECWKMGAIASQIITRVPIERKMNKLKK